MLICAAGTVDPDTGKIKLCGEPATQVVQVGTLACKYCDAHAERARAFVARVGNPAIAAIQRRTGLT